MNIKIAQRVLVSTLCSLALMSVIAVSGQAQDKSPQTQDKPPVAGIVPLGVAVIETQAVATGWRASNLMHADVYNDNNQKIG